MISKVTYLERFEGSNSPARINRATGELQINKSTFSNLPENFQRFIILHELAHKHLDSSNEMLVDQTAFIWYAEQGYSLKDAVSALALLLQNNNPQHQLRVKLQLERAKLYDYVKNGNKAVYDTNEETIKKQFDNFNIGESLSTAFNQDNLSKTLGSISGAVVSVANAARKNPSAPGAASPINTNTTKAPAKKDNTFTYLAIGAGFILVCGIIYLFIKKN